MSNFPIWKTVKIEENGQEFEIDLVLVTANDLGINLPVTNRDELLNRADSCGLKCLDFYQGLFDRFKAEKHRNIECYIIYIILSNNSVYLIRMDGSVSDSLKDVNFYSTYHFVFVKPRALKATAGAPLKAA